MNLSSPFDRRPILVAIAGPNGAGKTTFFQAHLGSASLRFVNPDVLARELDLDPYVAARAADVLRRELVRRRESFVFETVFSDPAGEKLSFLRSAAASGYTVVLCFIGLASPRISGERVAMRVSKGGHDVPPGKLKSRFPRILANLRAALRTLPHGLVYDNSDLRTPFRRVARFEKGQCIDRVEKLPRWLARVLRS